MEAIEGKKSELPDFELVDKLSKVANVAIPNAVEEIKTAPTRHDHVVEINQMVDAVKEFLGI